MCNVCGFPRSNDIFRKCSMCQKAEVWTIEQLNNGIIERLNDG
jgi:hypothetical protein